MERLDELIQEIDRFNKERDWDQFHSPSNLAKSISIESSELLECFQWNDDNYNVENVCEELADVLNYCLQLALVLKVDPVNIIKEKMTKINEKYPINRAKGTSKKYTEI